MLSMHRLAVRSRPSMVVDHRTIVSRGLAEITTIRSFRRKDYQNDVDRHRWAVSKNFGAYQDAAVREPVIITKNGRPRIVLLAYEDYLRLSRRDRRVEATADLRGADRAAVEKSEMEPGLDHLNAELLTNKHPAD